MKALKHIQYTMQMYCSCIMMLGAPKVSTGADAV